MQSFPSYGTKKFKKFIEKYQMGGKIRPFALYNGKRNVHGKRICDS